jgi:hypothetical protein
MGSKAPGPKIDRAIQYKIGGELRAMYEELLRQPLPEKLVAPLMAIDEVESSCQRLKAVLETMAPSSRRRDYPSAHG